MLVVADEAGVLPQPWWLHPWCLEHNAVTNPAMPVNRAGEDHLTRKPFEGRKAHGGTGITASGIANEPRAA
jgi:hypothetical protein